ncbi:hypothetical protein SHIRM173S_00999 [Streptomyces hirsutus]
MPLPRNEGTFFVQGFVPGHEESLQESHDSEHGESERTGHQNSGPGVIKTGKGRLIGDVHTERLGAATEVFADDHADDGERGAELQCVEDEREGIGQAQQEGHLARAGREGLHDLHVQGRDLEEPPGGVDEHREEHHDGCHPGLGEHAGHAEPVVEDRGQGHDGRAVDQHGGVEDLHRHPGKRLTTSATATPPREPEDESEQDGLDGGPGCGHDCPEVLLERFGDHDRARHDEHGHVEQHDDRLPQAEQEYGGHRDRREPQGS